MDPNAKIMIFCIVVTFVSVLLIVVSYLAEMRRTMRTNTKLLTELCNHFIPQSAEPGPDDVVEGDQEDG